jgi:MYXO-CTERM domain-containing protein
MRTWMMVVFLAVAMAFVLALAGSAALAGVVTIADAEADFAGPPQGQSNGYGQWYYGSTPYDTRGSYDPNTMFHLLQYFNSSSDRWQYSATAGSPSWVMIWPNSCHPGDLNLAVRRWVSDVAGEVTIHGTIRTHSTNSNGTYSYVWVDGVRLYHAFHDGGAAAKDYSITTTIGVGSLIEFGLDHAGATANDGTQFSSFIDMEFPDAAIREPASLGLLGLALLGLKRRRRRA